MRLRKINSATYIVFCCCRMNFLPTPPKSARFCCRDKRDRDKNPEGRIKLKFLIRCEKKLGTVSSQKSQWFACIFHWLYGVFDAFFLVDSPETISSVICTRRSSIISPLFHSFYLALSLECFISLTFIYTTNTSVKNVENLLLLGIFYFHYQQKKREKKASDVLNVHTLASQNFPHICNVYIKIWKLR